MSLSNLQAKQLFEQLAAKAGFTQDQVKLALEAEEWKELQNRDNRHSEYSSALDKVKNLEPLAQKAKQWDEWWTEKGGSKLYETQQQQAQRLALYQERFGELDPQQQQQVQQAAASGMSMQQVTALIDSKLNEQGTRFSQYQAERDRVFVEASNLGIKLTADDLTAMNNLMSTRGVTYAQAAQEHLGPRVRELEDKKRKDEMEQYAQQKVQDELARRGVAAVPITSQTPSANFFDRPKNGVAERTNSDQELLAMWAESAPGAQGRAA